MSIANAAHHSMIGGGEILSLPALKVEGSGLLYYKLQASITPPYTIAMWVKQNEYQPSTSAMSGKEPLFFSLGGESTGIGIGRSGQLNWAPYFAALNQPRYWARFESYTLADNRDWHFIVLTTRSGTYPFSLWVDNQATTEKDNGGGRAVRTTPINSYLAMFGRTTGSGAVYDSQWRGSVANIAFYNRAVSSSEAETLYNNRYSEDLTATHFWRCELTNNIVNDLVGNFNLSKYGTVTADVPIIPS